MWHANGNANGDAYIHTDCDCDCHGNGHIHSDCDCHGNSYAYTDSNADCDSDIYCNGYGYGNCDGYGNSYCDQTAAAFTDAATSADTAASSLAIVRTLGNSRDKTREFPHSRGSARRSGAMTNNFRKRKYISWESRLCLLPH
jgi:hypothetical protein